MPIEEYRQLVIKDERAVLGLSDSEIEKFVN
jgi:hypothetical protein